MKSIITKLIIYKKDPRFNYCPSPYYYEGYYVGGGQFYGYSGITETQAQEKEIENTFIGDDAMREFWAIKFNNLQEQDRKLILSAKNLIVWDKGNHTAGDLGAQYGKRYEFIIYANKGRAPFQPDMPRLEDIWHFPKVAGKEQIHQNQKPTNLLSQIINQHTKEGDLILDPFAGSCSTAVAAYRLKRDYIGFEIDPVEYAAGTKWLDAVRSQMSIFDFM